MKKTKSEKFIIGFTALLIVLTMLLSACSSTDESGVRSIKSVESRNTIAAECEDPSSLHYSKGASAFTEKAGSSGLIELYIDPSTNSFCIAGANKTHIWTALPLLDDLTENELPGGDASMATLKVMGGTDIYYLNTQDNSMKFGKAGYAITESGAEFNFDIFVDEKTAKKEKLTSDDIAFNLKINVALVDGSMIVNCKCSNLTENKNAHVESIELLNYFGAYNNSGEDDFLLVPDGCGAAVRTSVFDNSFKELSFAVYGEDLSCSEKYSGSACVPSFGIKHGTAAFVSLIQQGDACAVIHADKVSAFSNYNRVYASFNITPSKYENDTLYISKASFDGTLRLCYRFLFDRNATYAGLASACREQLIRDSVLSSVSVEDTAYLPFFLTVTGAVKKSVGPFRYLSTLTTFDQACDMLMRMKSKGINNVALRYAGALSGGTDSTNADRFSVLMRLGGSRKLSKLFDYVTAQKMGLFLDIDILSSASGFGSNSVSDIERNPSVYTADNPLADAVKTQPGERELRKPGKLSKTVNSVLADSKHYDFSGFCINDAGSILYSDFSLNGILRSEAAKSVTGAIAPLATSRVIMAENGNFYMLRNIDYVIDIPLETTVPASGAYQPVPFVQLILHGSADYAGYPINTQTNLEESLLRCIEYGACPHFKWNYEPLTKYTENDTYYYDNTINSAAEFYRRANETLNDLRSARMTEHYEVQDGVFCTEYDTGSMIYVNYTDSDCVIMGAVVEARDFLRVN